MSNEDHQLLLARLCREPESPWLEFKENFRDLDGIGEYISALSNSAVLSGKPYAYLVWGVEDKGHRIVGTSFDPLTSKKGNEDLEHWLVRLLEPQVSLDFIQVDTGGSIVWILQIGAARSSPVAFKGREYIRVGSYKKPLREHTDHQRRLWRAFEREVFENGTAEDRLRDEEVFDLMDYSSYFDLMQIPLPSTRRRILELLAYDKLLARSDVGYSITNLGAILFAKDLASFPTLARKQVRVIEYAGSGRTETLHEQVGVRGYASGFSGLIDYVLGRLPRTEEIGPALRVERSHYPPLAVRELVANMLIHQDFSISGTGPTIEIFDGRIEITNPGVPIVDSLRFLDLPPISRNEALASVMRRSRICEERGTGWDKVALAAESNRLPAPYVVVTPEHTRAVLLAPRPLTKMDKENRVRAVYLHACLNQVNDRATTNASVRERFGIEASSSAQASRLLGDAVEAGLVSLEDPTAGYRSRRYVPFWNAEG